MTVVDGSSEFNPHLLTAADMGHPEFKVGRTVKFQNYRLQRSLFDSEFFPAAGDALLDFG